MHPNGQKNVILKDWGRSRVPFSSYEIPDPVIEFASRDEVAPNPDHTVGGPSHLRQMGSILFSFHSGQLNEIKTLLGLLGHR
jgi:hypothetical protein